MRIGMYGLPSAGKTYILEKLDFIDVFAGSKLLREYDANFDIADEATRKKDRKQLAKLMMKKENFIMDGHYSFGDKVVFTEEDGALYDAFLYLYVDPLIIQKRMQLSDKNKKYLKYNISEWQKNEIVKLREYCHKNGKDFYLIDNPPFNTFDDVTEVISFIKDIVNGYSCVSYANKCSKTILERELDTDIIYLVDGDKTLIKEDSSYKVFGYKTQIFDGNCYTGYQMWKQKKEFMLYDLSLNEHVEVNINEKVSKLINSSVYILTSGHEGIWSIISKKLNIPYFGSDQMSSDTKMFIVKELQKNNKKIIAIGDSMNDYFMLKSANEAFLVTKEDDKLSKSLTDVDLEGINFV